MSLTTAAVKPTIEQSLAKRTYILLLVVSLSAAFLLTWMAAQRFEKILLPQVLAKSNVIGLSVQNTVEDALKLGIPFESLVGIHEFLSDTLAENPEIAFIQVQRDGHPGYLQKRTGVTDIHAANIVTQQIAASGSAPGVTIGVRASYLYEKLYVMFGDAAVMSLVALVTGLEIALFFAFRWLLRPFDTWRAMISGLASGDIDRDLRQPGRGPFADLLHVSNQKIAALRAARPQGAQVKTKLQEWYRPLARDVRLALFLFVLSEELLRSFFPLYVKELVDTTSRLGAELAITAPLMAYMFFASIGTLFGGNMVDRFGLGRAFGVAVGLQVCSLCGLAAASTLVEVVVWRSVAAIGYAVATIACQVYIARTVESGGNTRGFAVFVAAVTAACICGAPIGAVLADIFGKPAALLCAAGVGVLSWLVYRGVPLPPNPAHAAQGDSRAMTGGMRELLNNRRVQLLMCCAVAPGKLMLSGLLFYITPLLLFQYGLSQASSGQFFILYYAMLMFGNALSSRLVGNVHAQARLITIGAFLTGAGALLMFRFDSPLALAGAITCFGGGQSLVLAPVTAVLLKIVAQDLPRVAPPKAIALSRIFERIGGIAGAALGAVLSAKLGYQGAVAMLGALVIVVAFGTIPLMRSFSASGGKHA